MSQQRREERRETALSYAIESRKSHYEASAIVDAAKEFLTFLLSDSETESGETESRGPGDKVTQGGGVDASG